MAFSAHGYLHSVLDSGWNLDFDGLFFPLQARASASAAGVGDYLALALALGAGGIGYGAPEERVHRLRHLAAAMACRAGFDVRFVLGTPAVALRAGAVALYGYFLLASVLDLFQRESHAGADVPAAHRVRATGTG